MRDRGEASQAVAVLSSDRHTQVQGVVSSYGLAFTRCCFASKLYCGSQSSYCCPPPTCKAYPIAILLHDHCAIYALPPTPRQYAIHDTILLMAISCKGQATGGVEPRAHQVQRGRQPSLAQSSAPDWLVERTTGGEPPRGTGGGPGSP